MSRRSPEAALPQQTLEDTADAALLMQPAQGAPSLQLSIRSELFEGLRCGISVGEAGVTATFCTQDATTRRLLEAEAGKLRNLLEARGLKVATIRVVSADQLAQGPEGDAIAWLAGP